MKMTFQSLTSVISRLAATFQATSNQAIAVYTSLVVDVIQERSQDPQQIEQSLILFVFWHIFIGNMTRHGTPSGTAPGRVVLFMGASAFGYR
jgi:hypothetical protein